MGDQNDRTRSRRYCESHDGSRTATFIKFKRDFRTGASAHFMNEDDFSIWQVFDDTHQGGLLGPPIPAPGRSNTNDSIALRATGDVLYLRA